MITFSYFFNNFFIFSWNVLQEISEISFVPVKIIIVLYSQYEKVIFLSFPINRSEDNHPKASTQVFLTSCKYLQIESEIIKALYTAPCLFTKHYNKTYKFLIIFFHTNISSSNSYVWYNLYACFSSHIAAE